MKITKEVYVNYLINFYDKIYAHKDYQELDEKKLKVLNKILKIEDKVIFDYEKKKIILKPIENYLNRRALEGVKIKYNLEYQDRFSYYVDYINYIFNNILEKNKRQCSIGEIELTTNSEAMMIKKSINQFLKNKIISSHEEQIKKEYRIALIELLNILYGIEDYGNLNTCPHAQFNNEANEEEIKILTSNLNDEDYF